MITTIVTRSYLCQRSKDSCNGIFEAGSDWTDADARNAALARLAEQSTGYVVERVTTTEHDDNNWWHAFTHSRWADRVIAGTVE